MNLFKSLFAVTLLGFALSCQADIKADKDAVNKACAQDAQTANCPDAKMGTGLLKCLHQYKKANKGFKNSETCQSALDNFNQNKLKSKQQNKTQPPAATTEHK